MTERYSLTRSSPAPRLMTFCWQKHALFTQNKEHQPFYGIKHKTWRKTLKLQFEKHCDTNNTTWKHCQLAPQRIVTLHGLVQRLKSWNHTVSQNKQHHMKVLSSSFPKNGHSVWFNPQTKKLEPHCITKQTAPQKTSSFPKDCHSLIVWSSD